MACVFPRLGGCADALRRDKPDHLFRLWQPRGAGLAVAALVLLSYIALNVAILVVVPRVSLTSHGKGQGLPGRYCAAVVISLVALALAYYALVVVEEEVPGLWGPGASACSASRESASAYERISCTTPTWSA